MIFVIFSKYDIINKHFKMVVYSLDKLFSFWIFFWFLLYYVFCKNNKKYDWLNPKLALWLGLFVNIGVLFFVFVSSLFYEINVFNTFSFFLQIILFKYIPILMLNNTRKIKWVKDFFVTFIIFCVYLIYLYVFDVKIIKILNLWKLQFYQNKNNNHIVTPFNYFLQQLFQIIFHNK